MSGILKYTGQRGRGDDPDEIKFPGIDFSNGRKPLKVIELEFGNKDILVVKHPGGKCWAGNYQPWQHVPSKFMVFKILSQRTFKDKGHSWTEYNLDMLADIPVSAGRKKSNVA